jgi:predicted TIM-barrel fold metal-dependent hydrolase
MIVDTETHVFAREMPIETNPGFSRVLRTNWHEYSGDLLIDEMDRADVDHTFLISYDGEDILWGLRAYLETQSAEREDFWGGRKYTRAFVEKYPDRFLWFATVKHPAREQTIGEIRRDFADGALGLKIFPPYLNLPATDPGLMEIYRICAQENRRVILSFEDTLPPETPSVPEYWEQLDKVLTEFPALQVQLNHAGAGSWKDPASDPLNPEAEVVFRVTNEHENLLLSTALLDKVCNDEHEYPFPNYLRRLEKLKSEVGAEKLAWATDWPFVELRMTYPQAVDSIRKHASFFTDTERGLFLGENARRFVEDLVPTLKTPGG